MSARGSGSLKITDIHFAAKGEAFAYTLPDGVELPYEMASGLFVCGRDIHGHR